METLRAGDVLSIRLSGSGGYGPPWERDPERVAWDVKNGKVSKEAALRDYLVVIRDDFTVDMEATKILRRNRTKSPGGET
ncbi:MAG: hypothetical protein DRG31_07030 [Deltaproteobacteria bacterium]|nr:MAG: hypothetical protein DRG31_07030 [Deltaproteobacteria bacterium]